MNARLDEKTTIAWAQFAAILTTFCTVTWMLAQLTSEVRSIGRTLNQVVTQVNGHGERIIRLEATK